MFTATRVSPYFFNAGLISTGPLLNSLGTAYAHTIAEGLSAPGSKRLPAFDVLFGPAYKGISLAAVTAVLLHSQHNLDVGFAYDRKEAKDHGEGGRMVGVPVALDREEIGHEGKSAIKELEAELGGEGRVLAILRMRDLITWLRDKGRHEDIERMQAYWEQFGVKE